MKARGAAIQGALALTGLVAAYATWQREPERATGGEVVVLDLGRDDLERVRYDDGSKWVELQRRGSNPEPAVWVRLGSRPAAAPDGGMADGGTVLAAAKEPKIPDREVVGNEAAQKLLEKFTPLRASRALGVLDEVKLQELGLAESKKRMEVNGRGKRASYVLASSALGAGAPYLQDEQDRKVYLLGSTILSDLDGASTRLVDRRLHSFKPADYDSVLLKVDNKQKEFAQSSSEPQKPLKLTPKKSPDKPDDFARNWHDKIWHLIVTEVLGKGEVPASGEPAPAVRIEYLQHGKQVGWIELSQGRAAASGSPGDLYARTEHTAGWDKVHSVGEDLLKEAKKVVSEER